MSRALRYSSGRDRIELKRQQQRMLTQQGWQRDKMDKNEERAATQYGWTEEDLDTQKERWAIMRDLQRQQMQLAYEYQESMLAFRDKDIALMKDSMKLQEDQHAKWLENYAIETPLLLQQHELDKAQKNAKLKIDQDSLELAKVRFAQDVEMLGYRRQQEDNELEWNYAMTVGFDAARQILAPIDAYIANVGVNLAKAAATAAAFSNIMTNYYHGAYDGTSSTTGGTSSSTGTTYSTDPAAYAGYGATPANANWSSDDWSGLLDNLKNLITGLNNKSTIVVDAESLRTNGFVHVDDFSMSYN